MRWIKSLDGVQVVLSGMGDVAQVEENAHTFSEEPGVNDQEREVLKQAAALLRKDIALPCTGCRYCVPNCPMGLDIPSLLISYNDMKADASWRLINLFGLAEAARPSACIGCGACTAHCPQSLRVPDAMKEMAEVMNHLH